MCMNCQIYLFLKKTTITVLFFISGVFVSQSSASEFDEVYRFLQIPSTPHAAGLGGNMVSLPETDANAFMINPAYLNETQHRLVGLSYLNYITDINTGVASGIYDIRDYGTFGFGIKYMDYGDFTRTDADGQEHGSFRSYDVAITTGWGYAITDDLQGGISLHSVLSSYDTYSSSAVAVSGGLLYTINDQTHAGVTVNHLGRQITNFDQQTEPLPLDVRAGISRRLTHLPLRLSVTFHSLHQWDMPIHQDDEDPGFTSNFFRRVNVGGEFLFTENVQLRIGYNHLKHEELKADSRIDLAGAGIGLGINVNRFRFDFSRTNYSDVGALTQLSVQMRL